jgi:NAD(P)-dependent dehydrogenase (short-subunit alcohol dehydrogenase family)
VRYIYEDILKRQEVSILIASPTGQYRYPQINTMSHQKVILVLGSGANIGRHVARAFTAKGYKVALASRSLKDKESEPGQVHFPIDLSDPASVPNLFSEVTEKLRFPSVVVYNGEYMCLHSTRLCVDMITAAAATANDPEDTFSISLNDFIKDLNINTTSPFAAAKAAVSGFSQLPESASKTFIYTGNVPTPTLLLVP